MRIHSPDPDPYFLNNISPNFPGYFRSYPRQHPDGVSGESLLPRAVQRTAVRPAVRQAAARGRHCRYQRGHQGTRALPLSKYEREEHCEKSSVVDSE